MNMTTEAVVMEAPGQLSVTRLGLSAPSDDDVVVETEWSGISTGTERLLWTGRMPNFPGMGYPLVPGYESVGVVRYAGSQSGRTVGERVFVPGASCYQGARGLFGGAASRLVAAGQRVVPLGDGIEEQGVLLALAATAYHALAAEHARPPDLIVGHGVLGRLLARLALADGAPPPTVWELDPGRRDGDGRYPVAHPDDDPRVDYHSVYDVSGDSGLLDTLIGRLGRGGEIVLAGFYSEPLSFAFPAAFARELRLRVAAEWRPQDLQAVQRLLHSGQFSLDGLISHRQPFTSADEAYRTAFDDPACLKMILDWRPSL